MKKFISRLAIAAALMLLVLVGMHGIAIWSLRDDVESAYTISPHTEVLFIGSSQVGCAIDEDRYGAYRLQKLWVSDSITPSFLMRLRELERRGQLDHLKTVVVPFNVNSVTHQADHMYLWAWYLELPVSWRSFDLLPYGMWEFVKYNLCNLRFPIRMHVCELPPEREGLSSRPQVYREKFLASIAHTARDCTARAGSEDLEKRLFDAYDEMRTICERHGIRFVIFKAPLLPAFEQNLSEDARRRIGAYEQRLRDMHFEYIKPHVDLDERHFFDDVHLIPSAAKLFTSELFHLLRSTHHPPQLSLSPHQKLSQ